MTPLFVGETPYDHGLVPVTGATNQVKVEAKDVKREASQGNAERGMLNGEQGERPESSDIQRSSLSVHRSGRVPILAMIANAMQGHRARPSLQSAPTRAGGACA
jgi:hypothetical protein